MTDTAAIVNLWTAGSSAPYTLFEADDIISGTRLLVEQVADDRPALIARGDEISDTLARRVAAQVAPPLGEPMDVHVLVRDENGEPTYDEVGDPITEVATVRVPISEPVPLSLVAVADVDVPLACDMCGRERAPRKRIGDGSYCSEDFRSDGGDEPKTCFDLRMEQMA